MTKEELEKEAKDYADWFWGASPSMMKALAEAYFKGAEPREKRIAELETRCNELFLQTCEQAEKIKELKEYNKYLRRKRQGGIQKQYNKVAIIKQQDDQLTKAKEIIKGLLSFVDSLGNYSGGIFYKAEQFIREVEK